MFAEFTTPQMIFISAIAIGLLYASIRLYSAISMLSWGFSMITLVGVMEYGLEIEYFWISLIFVVFALMISMIIYSYNKKNV